MIKGEGDKGAVDVKTFLCFAGIVTQKIFPKIVLHGKKD